MQDSQGRRSRLPSQCGARDAMSPSPPLRAASGSRRGVRRVSPPSRQTWVVPVWLPVLRNACFHSPRALAWLSHGSPAAGGYQEIY